MVPGTVRDGARVDWYSKVGKQEGVVVMMRVKTLLRAVWCVCCLALCMCLCACDEGPSGQANTAKNENNYLTFLDVEPASADPQCILENYTVPLNVFDRLVEFDGGSNGSVLKPSLANSWEVSEDGLRYTFYLREGVEFSNGEKLTADDVRFSFERLIAHPKSVHQDLALGIVGAEELKDGTADSLAGFEIVDDHTFSIVLSAPSASFLASLSTPAASILDEETTRAAGDAFGRDVDQTVGTGPFVLKEWEEGKSITMAANRRCWNGAPASAGLKMTFYAESVSIKDLYTQGKIDIIDLEKLGMDAEYFLRGDAYKSNLVQGRRVGITFLTLNESVHPLDDVRVRKALQLALDREALLMASVGGRGDVEHGMFPRGLVGHNESLPAIPYDPERAQALFEEAGVEEGLELEITYPLPASQSLRDMLDLAASMWRDLGMHVFVIGLSADEFEAKRSAGELACYAATYSADCNDPQNVIRPFFGSAQNTRLRSLCYDDKEVMERVRQADAIASERERIAEYQALEKKIVQEDAAWVPVYSRMHYFVVSDRVKGFKVGWNGWSSIRYDNVSLTSAGE